MRRKSRDHTFASNIDLRQKQLEAELAKIPDLAERERIMAQIRDLEAARQMESYLRPPER